VTLSFDVNDADVIVIITQMRGLYSPAPLLFASVALISVVACADPEGTAAQDVAETAPEKGPAETETEIVAAESPETSQSAADSLASLDRLLPEEFSDLFAPWAGDLDGMVERNVIRTLVVSGGPQFFYFQGKPRGMTTELLYRLQEQLNEDLGRGYRELEVLPMPVSRDRLIPALVGGSADLIAADLTITEGRSELVDFTEPLVTNIDEIVVFAPDKGSDVVSLDGISGNSVYVRRSSSYFEHLEALNRDFVSRGLAPVRIDTANEMLRDQDILEMVNAGIIDATVIDSYKASYWGEIFPDMRPRDDLVVNEGGDIAWMIRKDSPQLKAALDKFVRGHRQGTLIGNVLINRYMENLQWVRNSTSDAGIQRLRPLLEMFRIAGEESDLDPLMLAAQAYQESELDHDKVSRAGARGIMQIKPSTAADPNVGIDDISSPTDNIRAGARYMRFMMERYFADDGIDPLQSWLFALAAYNAGPARVQQLRSQADREGHDRNSWVDNVELIAERKIGRETVRYVRNVFTYYVAYRLAVEAGEQRRNLSIN
jgi:membrane-bound lytic murein transglycosylase MltF